MNRDPILIGLTGRAGSGKDTAADHLVREYGFERAAFADVLRTMLEAMFTEVDVDYAHLYEPHLKNTPIAELGMVSARELMQTLGTEWGRRCNGPDWWLRLTERRLGLAAGGSPVHDRIVITDVRFPNEAEWIKRRGGMLVQLHRETAAPVRAHESERHFSDMRVDLTLFNNGPTLVGLHGMLDGAMATWGIERRESLECGR